MEAAGRDGGGLPLPLAGEGWGGGAAGAGASGESSPTRIASFDAMRALRASSARLAPQAGEALTARVERDGPKWPGETALPLRLHREAEAAGGFEGLGVEGADLGGAADIQRHRQPVAGGAGGDDAGALREHGGEVRA